MHLLRWQVMVFTGHSRLLHLASPHGATGHQGMNLNDIMLYADHVCVPGFIILAGSSGKLPETARAFVLLAGKLAALLWLAHFSGMFSAAGLWMYASQKVHICFSSSRRLALQHLVRLSWSKQDDLACIDPPLSDDAGYQSAVWFLAAFGLFQSVAFVGRMVGGRRLLLPIAIACALFVPAEGAHREHWTSLVGAFYSRVVFKKALPVWWMFALAEYLPRDFPLRLPGEGCSRWATRNRTRCAWVAVWVLIIIAGRPLENALARYQSTFAGGVLLLKLTTMGLRLGGAIGLCAAAPTGWTLFTHAGRGTIWLLLLNQYSLALLKGPLTLSVIYALECFGARTAACVAVGLVALLAWATHTLVSAALQPVAQLVREASSHVKGRRFASAARRALPLLVLLVGAVVFVHFSTPLHGRREHPKAPAHELLHGGDRYDDKHGHHQHKRGDKNKTTAEVANHRNASRHVHHHHKHGHKAPKTRDANHSHAHDVLRRARLQNASVPASKATGRVV